MSDFGFARAFHLESILMARCNAERGPGSMEGNLRLETEAQINAAQDGQSVTYVTTLKYQALDEADESLIAGSVELALSYRLEDGFEPSQEHLETYAYQAVAFQAHPYLREHVMSMCSRSGLPPIALPVLQREGPPPTLQD